MDESDFVFISLGDLLQSRRVNTDVTPDDSHDAELFCSCGPGQGCTNCPDPDPDAAYYTCGDPECDICVCDDGLSEEDVADLTEFICNTLDEIEAEEPEFDDPIDAAVVVGVSTLVAIADDESASDEVRLDAAELLLDFWANATLGR